MQFQRIEYLKNKKKKHLRQLFLFNRYFFEIESETNDKLKTYRAQSHMQTVASPL